MYYLDTNTCIYFLNGKYKSIRDKILSTNPIDIRIPSIVKAELLLGAYKSRRKAETVEKVNCFLQYFKVEDFTDEMTYTYAAIRTELETNGKSIGPNDLLIAAIVKNKNGTLVTNNVNEFARVSDLKIENWV